MMAVLGAASATADEGMWLFNVPPKRLLKDRYGFDVTPEWLDHLRESAVRFPGGSGSFVSADGLVMTNHHVGSDFIDQLSSAELNFMRDGFSAKSRSEELKCPDLEVNILAGIEDVTEKVDAAVKPGMDLGAAQKARQAAINTIEQESQERTGLKSQVVILYHGALYHVYRYRRYTDVRLVFAPEQQIAFFGGDPDNFEYPRFNLDICFFRVYENDKPLESEHFLAWKEDGIKDGDLAFLIGHPGRTNRLYAVAHLEYLRDVAWPEQVDTLRQMEVTLSAWGNRSPENARRAGDDLFGVQNARKRRIGGLETLLDPAFVNAKQEFEAELRARTAADPRLKDNLAAWDEVAEATRKWREIRHDYNLYERAEATQSKMFMFARELVRFAEETPKPNAERLREFSNSTLPSLKDGLIAPVPVYPDLETVKLRSSFVNWVPKAGATDPLVVKVLAGRSPAQAAEEMISNSKMHDAAYRKELLEGGPAAIHASHDPLLELARAFEPKSREARKAYDQQVEERLRQAYAKIAAARVATGGDEVYPDATFSLRLAFGPVAGYEEGGKKVDPFTSFAGLYERSAINEGRRPFDLPKRWMDAKAKLKLDTPFNFVAKLDLTGGNSGSPIVDREGRLVGIVFDSNIFGLALDVGYTEKQARSIGVDARGIIEALRNVYDARVLVDELLK